MSVSSSDIIRFKGLLLHHDKPVTTIATPPSNRSDIIMSGSVDKKVVIWKLSDNMENHGAYPQLGYAYKALSGHNERVSDLVMSSDGNYALSGSWDKTVRLWDLTKAQTLRRCVGHEKSVFSVAFSSDNRQIISAGQDKQIRLWNTLAECKYKLENDQHEGWISSVRFSPDTKNSLVVSGGWDNKVKVWDLAQCVLRKDLCGHTGVVESVTISPDGSLCASGGRDGIALLWDVADGKLLYQLEANAKITCVGFSPKEYWLCIGTENSVKLIDLENKEVLAEITPEVTRKAKDLPWCRSLAWSVDGRTLYIGTQEGQIHAFDANTQ